MEENKNNINDNETESINPIKKEESIEEKKIEEVKPVTPVPESMPNPEGKKKGSGAVAILTVIIILLVIGLIYMLVFYKDKDEGKDNNDSSKPTPTPTVTPTPTPGVTPTPTPSVTPTPTSSNDKENELIVYKQKDGDLCTSNYCSEQRYGETEAFRIKVSSKNAKLLEDANNRYILYDDNGIKIYDAKTKGTSNIDLKNEYEDYNFHISEDGNRVIGIGVVDSNDYMSYYNVSLKKIFYTNKKYKVNSFPFLIAENDKYISLDMDNASYLLSVNEEKEALSYTTKDSYESCSFDSHGDKNGYIYILSCGGEDYWQLIKAYDENLKEFYNKKTDEYGFYQNYIYIGEDNNVKKYDTNGNLVFTSKAYEKDYMIVKNYVLYKKDSNLILENIENPSETKVITKMKDDWIVDWASYYSREMLDEIDEKNKKEGLYIVIYYSYMGNNKDSKGNYGMEYCYTSDKQIVEYPIKNELGGRAKPVLYLYPEEETNVNVKFAHPEYLTTTYPKYNGSWEVTAKPNGDLTDKDGKYYYALYWDEKRYNEVDFHEGFYVEGKDAISFLEEKLSIIGLNDKEKNEFIMYWLPIMEANKKNLVYFELTEEREKDNKLIITPTPDSLLRVSIHIKKVNEKVKIKEQKLTTFKRVGFTAVEWGGMTY